MADPSDSQIIDEFVANELLNLLNTSNGYSAPINQANVPVHSLSTCFGIANVNDNNLPSDPMIWNSFNRTNHGTQLVDSEQNLINGGESLLARNPGIRKAIPLPKWPREPEPYYCDCCQVLRELVHTDGTFVTRLEIHGRPGIIDHAILSIQKICDSCLLMSQCHKFDFSKKSPKDVKQFMLQYISDRNKGGFTKVHDPLTMFYETICFDLEIEDGLDAEDSISSPTSTSSGVGREEQAEAEDASTSRVPKSGLAAQRERAKRMKLKDLRDVFHLPINKASEKLDLCPTVVKKICRREGMNRWPHRKIKSIEKQIESYRPMLASMYADERLEAGREILKLEQEVADIMASADN